MTDSDQSLERKKERLVQYLKGVQTLGVGFSGGVDSTLLLAVASQVIGDRVVALTALSPTHPRTETDNAGKIARELGVRHHYFESDEMLDGDFTANGPQRCYHCKKHMFHAMRQLADRLSIGTLAHGANLDDQSDHRPGQLAAEEAGIEAPLSQMGFTKSDIRALAKTMGLPNWNQPSMACLATRLPYGVAIEPDLLQKIARAETLVRQAGITQCRVRHHGNTARIEVVDSEMEKLLDGRRRRKLIQDIRALGYTFVCLDLEGFESGKMNRELSRITSSSAGLELF